MPVATLFNFYYSGTPQPQPIVAEHAGGISGDGLEATDMHLEGIYIPNKLVFYAVHHGEHEKAGQQFWHNTTRAHLSERGKMQAADLREFFSGKNLGLAFWDATNPSKVTSKSVRPGFESQKLPDLQPRGLIETKDKFKSRIRARLRALIQLGYRKPASVLVTHEAVLRELVEMFSKSAIAIHSGSVLAVQYNSKLNKLEVKQVHKFIPPKKSQFDG